MRFIWSLLWIFLLNIWVHSEFTLDLLVVYFGFTWTLLLRSTIRTEVWRRPLFYLNSLLPVIPGSGLLSVRVGLISTVWIYVKDTIKIKMHNLISTKEKNIYHCKFLDKVNTTIFWVLFSLFSVHLKKNKINVLRFNTVFFIFFIVLYIRLHLVCFSYFNDIVSYRV